MRSYSLDTTEGGGGRLSAEQEIEGLITRFSQFQATLGHSDRSFVAKFKELVSEKSWKLIRERKWPGHIKSDEVLSRLRALERRVDSTTAFNEQEFIDSMPFVRELNAEFSRLLSADKDRRGMIVLAPEGVGKSWWAASIVDEDPARRFYVHLASTWREKPLHILRGIADRIGASEEINPAAAQRAVVAKLNEINDPVLIIDEGHNGGIALWRLCKDLIATTKVRIVLMAFPTQFDQIRMSSTAAVAEARQFLRRCQRPILDSYRNGVKAEDIVAFLVGAGGFPKRAETEAVAAQLQTTVARNGNISVLSDALAEARAEADGSGTPLTLQLFAKALRELCGMDAKEQAAPVQGGGR